MAGIPNQWRASKEQKLYSYDEEGRLLEFNISRQSTGGIGDANSLYATDAERFSAKAPFIARAMEKDATRRNYVVQPGGATIYFDGPARVTAAEKVGYTVPDPKESFGHDSMDGVFPGPVTRPSPIRGGVR